MLIFPPSVFYACMFSVHTVPLCGGSLTSTPRGWPSPTLSLRGSKMSAVAMSADLLSFVSAEKNPVALSRLLSVSFHCYSIILHLAGSYSGSRRNMISP